MRSVFALLLAIFPITAAAEGGFRNTDVRLDKLGLTELIAGQILEFYDGGKSQYGADNRYGYTYVDDGPVWAGQYRVTDDSQVCVDFDNGSKRCDHIVINGKNAVLITADGTRFPIRNITVATN